MLIDTHRDTATGSTRPTNLHSGGRPNRGRPRPPHHQQAARVLLVEDNPGDVALVQRALRMWDTPAIVIVAVNGQHAIQMLRGTRPLPDLMLLDLNLPGLAGYEVLARIKLDPELRTLPVIVLSGSTDPGEPERSSGALANAFIRKTEDFTRFASAMRGLEDFWIKSLKDP